MPTQQFYDDENQKLNAALGAAMDVVNNSVLHGWSTEAKIKYLTAVLPKHYEVKECKRRKGDIRCISQIGITDNEKWEYFMKALKVRFKESFYQVHHNTCTNHVDFIIHFKNK